MTPEEQAAAAIRARSGQLVAAEAVSRRIREGSSPVAGILLESYLMGGAQRSGSATGLDPRTASCDPRQD